MPANYKILGQAAISATTNTDLYTVPSSTEAVISTIVIANRNNVPSLFRIAIRPNGAELALAQYVAYDVTVGASDSVSITLGITMSAGDILTVFSDSSTLTFSAFGTEITN
jgi:glucose-6-phosphate dehydrogenase assembly protein OpcA